MYLGYQKGKIKFYTEKPLNKEFYNLDDVVETQDEYVLDGEEYVLKDEAWEEKQKAKEEERIAHLFLTGADVERGIYKAKGMDFEDILSFVTANPPEGLNIKALKIELKANNFYRGNPYVNAIGTLLGFTKEQLDNFFEYNDYLYLTSCKYEVEAIPLDAIVAINGIEQKSIIVPYKSEVNCVVYCDGYKEQRFTEIVEKDTVKYIELEEKIVEPIEEN